MVVCGEFVDARDPRCYTVLDNRHDFTLKLQAVAETVTVSAEAPLVDATKAEVAGVVTRQQIETLPINSRQYLSLALLMPGTTVDATRSFFSTVNVGGSMTFNGTGNVVDGTINNWVEDGEPRQDLPEDAVEEFKVTNALPKAEFGLATGGVVQVVAPRRRRERILPAAGQRDARRRLDRPLAAAVVGDGGARSQSRRIQHRSGRRDHAQFRQSRSESDRSQRVAGVERPRAGQRVSDRYVPDQYHGRAREQGVHLR